jgi:hypothetical protein
VPDPPAWLPGPARVQWRALWRCEVAGLWGRADREGIARLAWLRVQLREGPPRAALLEELRALEDRMGLSLRARQVMGLPVALTVPLDPAAGADVELGDGGVVELEDYRAMLDG